jgi:hypothetical protein
MRGLAALLFITDSVQYVFAIHSRPRNCELRDRISQVLYPPAVARSRDRGKPFRRAAGARSPVLPIARFQDRTLLSHRPMRRPSALAKTDRSLFHVPL